MLPFKDWSRKKKIMVITGSVLAVGVTILVILITTTSRPSRGELLDSKDRIECPGFKNAAECNEHGCVYDYVKSGPMCFMKKDSFGYTLKDVSTSDSGMVANLQSRSTNTPHGPSIASVKVEITYITQEIVRVKLLDSQNHRYEVPVQKDFPLLKEKKKVDPGTLAYKVSVSNDSGIFSFQIRRSKENTIIWDSSIGGLVMSDKFLQIASHLPSNNIYGLGENVHFNLRHNLEYKTWPIFARDTFPEKEHMNLYGTHPYYTCLEKDSNTHGVLFLNSNAMEVTLLPAPGISFRTSGGIIDLFFIVGMDPETVVKSYTELVGRPIMPPYWGLGFQLSRFGYNSLDNVKKAVERTREAGIAQDVQFLDIDHMAGSRDFTINEPAFNGLTEYINKTREEYGMKWIIILDPAIEAVKGYHAYESGLKDDVFIKRSPLWKEDMFPEELRGNNITYGKVWPNKEVAFPDFLNKNAQNWWIQNIVDYHKQLPFDGLWIDMNEPANFGTNEEKPFYCTNVSDCWSLKCPESPYDDPPYNPLKSSGSDRLSEKTLCMESIQSDGTNSYRHYDVHSLYGWSQTEPTLKAAQQALNARSLVITRSTYPSSGRYAGHWLGDNKSIWKDMHRSILGMLEFNMFGIPYIGADVCGFTVDTTPELCKRWMQLGAFYPFFRNHNGMGQKEQDPAALGDDVTAASKRAVQRRYILNPYLYTLFYHAHTTGSTVVRPLFHEFPRDPQTWNIDEQFMWGQCLLISPVLREGQKSVRLYLPDREWWYFKYTESRRETKTGDYIEKVDIEDNTPLHVRGGCIIPTEDYQLKKSNVDQPKNITLYVFPVQEEATGDIYIDSLLSIDPIETGNYEVYYFALKNCSLEIKKSDGKSASFGTSLAQVHVFKVKSVKNVQVGSETVKRFSFNPSNNVLTIGVNKKFEDVRKIIWEDENKKCQMLP